MFMGKENVILSQNDAQKDTKKMTRGLREIRH